MRRRPRYISGRRPTLAVAVVVAAAVVTPVAVSTYDRLESGSADIRPTANEAVDTASTSVSLASAPAATDVDADIAGGGTEVKLVTAEQPFSMIGVTWDGVNPDAEVLVRAQQPDGSWGEWFDGESVDGDTESTTGRGGTEPVFLGTETTAVQVSLTGVSADDTSLAGAPDARDDAATTAEGDQAAATAEGAASEEPATEPGTFTDAAATIAPSPAAAAPTAAEDDALPLPTAYADIKPVAESTDLAEGTQVVLLSPDFSVPTPEPGTFRDIAAEGGTGVDSDISVRMPTIITRAGWGANERQRCRNATYDRSLAAATVHHTAGSNNYTRAQSAGVVRGIFTYHAVNLGWCDIGYNVLVDKYGQAFEGRHGGLTRNVQGAHAGGFNGNTFGISMMGDHSTVAPSAETIRTMGEVIGWRLAIAGVDPKGTDTHYSEGTSYTRYPRGTAVRLPNVFAHRDVGNTTCPGNAGYARMGQIRDIAAAYAGGGGGSPAPAPTTTTTTQTTSEAPRPTSTTTTQTTPQAPRPPVQVPGTGGGAAAGIVTPGSVQEFVSTSIRTVLAGGQLDAQTLTRMLAGGRTLSDIPVSAGSVADAAGGDIGRVARNLSGPLGNALSGLQRYGNVSLVKYENGAIYESAGTGAHPVWGVIGDAWAAQGFEHGPLGLPVSGEDRRDDGSVAQRFEHGTLVFTPSTGLVSVERNTP